MKIRFLPLIVAAVLAPAAAFAASPAELRRFGQNFATTAEAKLAASGVDLAGQVVKVQVTLSHDGRLHYPRVEGSTGRPETDLAVAAALKGVRLNQLPPMLAGRRVTLTLGGDHVVQAKAR
jgi:hypothetical protein